MATNPHINNLYSFQKQFESPQIMCYTQIAFPKILNKYHGQTDMPWQQILLTFWPWVEFQLLMAGDGFSSVVICIPLSCSGHMKPGWWETSLARLSATHCLAHCTRLSGELSSFFNAILPVASSEWQGESCEMDVQPQRSVRGQPELRARSHAPYGMLVSGQSVCWEQQFVFP